MDQKYTNRITPVGVGAALIFACGPFMYANIGGFGLFIYLMIFYIGMMLLQGFGEQKGKIFLYLKRTQKILLTFISWEIITYFWSSYNTSGNIYTSFKLAFFTMLLISNYYSENDKKLIMFTQTATAVFAVFLMLNTTRTVNVNFLEERASFSFFGVAQDPNYMCLFIIIPIIYLFQIILQKKKAFTKVLAGIFLILLFYGIMCTGSRGGLFGALLGIIIYFLFYKRISIKKILISLLFIFLLFCLYENMIRLLPDAVASRYSIEEIFSSGGTGSRTSLWLEYFSVLLEDPLAILIGFGKSSGPYMIGFAAHNYFIQEVFECGFVGLALLFCLILELYKQAIRRENWLTMSALSGVLILSCTLSVGSQTSFWLAVVYIEIISRADNCNIS